ncbi:RMD1 family protein [Sulfurospirillum barnesii]|uniref:DUF155 domain-containing protein n=1 Tax=Sulfurospirillum barnesii (strain ATCC 700032 / DSM 10660 / SES-3) TaxID=760154 RepID=I3XYR3_SULBS|nr:RMD1 family protein [Sulfurospirillum barnesii]AFL69087.1 hypothetical protein Sulba_1806 [Sulfurospirillum barnesii SES-3]
MALSFSIISISLPQPFARHEIETRLECVLKKGIEKAFYTQDHNRYLVYTQFNVLSFIHWEKADIIKALEKLGIKEASSFEQHCLYQDYPILIDPTLEFTCKISNEHILLKEALPLYLIIIALVISQSVGLEKYEQDLEVHFGKSQALLDLTKSYTFFKRSKLVEFTRNLISIQHGMVSELFLLDKPNILWDNEEAEKIYNTLSSTLELKDRFEIIEHKLNHLKENIAMALDLFNHKHSEVLEWIIIILIGVEIVMGLIEFFNH